MRTAYDKFTVDVIGTKAKVWGSGLEQLCQFGITPVVVIDETARTGP